MWKWKWVARLPSANVKAAEEILETLDKLTVEEHYLSEQIFSMDEASLFSTHMPERTLIHKEARSMPDFKAFKDRVTVLLQTNAAGCEWNPCGTVRTPRPSSISISTCCQCATGGNTTSGQPNFPSKVPSWVAVPWQMLCSLTIAMLTDSAAGHPRALMEMCSEIDAV